MKGGTVMCVRCLTRKADIWGGHVTKWGKKVIAGWCNRCHAADQRGQFQGWQGHWLQEMERKISP